MRKKEMEREEALAAKRRLEEREREEREQAELKKIQ